MDNKVNNTLLNALAHTCAQLKVSPEWVSQILSSSRRDTGSINKILDEIAFMRHHHHIYGYMDDGEIFYNGKSSGFDRVIEHLRYPEHPNPHIRARLSEIYDSGRRPMACILYSGNKSEDMDKWEDYFIKSYGLDNLTNIRNATQSRKSRDNVKSQLLAVLYNFDNWCLSQKWSLDPKARRNDQLVLRSLITLALDLVRTTAISASYRAIAEKIGINFKTVRAALIRLISLGHVNRISKGSYGISSKYNLLSIPVCTKTAKSDCRRDELHSHATLQNLSEPLINTRHNDKTIDCEPTQVGEHHASADRQPDQQILNAIRHISNLASHDAFRPGALGKAGYQIYSLIYLHETRVTAAQLSERLLISTGVVRRYLQILRSHGVITRTDGHYTLINDGEVDFNRIALVCHTQGKAAKQRKQHYHDRLFMYTRLLAVQFDVNVSHVNWHGSRKPAYSVVSTIADMLFDHIIGIYNELQEMRMVA